MRLTAKVISIVGILVSIIVGAIFTFLAIRIDNQIQENILATAQTIYKNIVTTREWVSNYDGVFVKKKPGEKPNIYLQHPEIFTTNKDTLFLKNPALVTRELSEINQRKGGDFLYHMASERFINPANKPDDFEKLALNFFADSAKTDGRQELYRTTEIDGKAFFQYFAPLYTSQSCLSCHSTQGYELGDLRGGISIMLSVDRYRDAQHSNIVFVVIFGIISVLGLSILVFFAIRRIIISPLRIIEEATRKIQKGNFDFELNLTQKDEVGKLARAFNLMRKKILQSTSKLKTSEEKYRNLINHSLEAVAIVDLSEKIVDSNAILEKLSLCSTEELQKMPFANLLGNQRKKLKKRSFMDSGVEYFESVLITKDFLEIPVEVYKIKGFSLDEKNELTFVYIRDLTERKVIEKYSTQAEKMFALGQLSSGIAHEIRNPLFSLTNNIEYLKEKSCDKEAFEEVYPELKYGLKRIQKIVSTILDYAKPHEVDFKNINIVEIVEKCVSLVKKQFEKSSVKMVTKFANGNYEIQADPHKMEQVFMNLFMNSFQAMEAHGILTIAIIPKNRFLEITITDTGKGIPQEDLKRIFDPFYSKSHDGTGLGLCIVQRVLDQHDAKYEVESEENFGTTFTIRLRREKG